MVRFMVCKLPNMVPFMVSKGPYMVRFTVSKCGQPRYCITWSNNNIRKEVW